MSRFLISLFGGYSLYFLFTTVLEFQNISWYIALIFIAFIFFVMLKFPKSILLNVILSVSTAVPFSYMMINFLSKVTTIKNTGINLDTAIIVLSVIIFILPKFKKKWFNVKLKNVLLTTSSLILLTNLSTKYIPNHNGGFIYFAIPLLLPIIYHFLLRKFKFIRTVFIGVFSYAFTVAAFFYFDHISDGKDIILQGNKAGLEVMSYLIPATFLVTLLLGFNPLKRPHTRRRFGYSGGGSYSGYSASSYENNDSSDDNDFSFMPSFDDYESNHSSYGGGSSSGGDDYNNWGLPQYAIDKRNDEEFYGQPSWYREKEIEEREYGLPWYARSDGDDD